jgi:FixJ family two-component response regulator
MNPWALTQRQQHILTVLVRCEGCSKLAARALDLSPKTVDQVVWRVKEEMKKRTRTGVILEWDRWLQDRAYAVAPIRRREPA